MNRLLIFALLLIGIGGRLAFISSDVMGVGAIEIVVIASFALLIGSRLFDSTGKKHTFTSSSSESNDSNKKKNPFF